MLTIKNTTIFLAAILSLSACMSEEERKAQQQAQYQADIAAAGAHCETIGFNKSTTLFAQCVQMEYQSILQQRELQFQKNQAFWQSVADAGAALQGDDEPSYNCKRDFGIMNTYTCDPM